jgi:two-component system, OmpR family, copper resistance phosphate regulon response regulator CusR
MASANGTTSGPGRASGEDMGIRILVVEDEANIADYLVRGLREEGFVVEHAADGVTAWHSLREGSWDLILLDWWLPGLEGLELLRLFRERDRRTPILFLTARDQVRDRVLALDSGADDYLCKPFDLDELLARIRALIRRRDGNAGTILTHGDTSVDLDTQRAERAGQPLDLTAKEQALLIYFLRNPGQVLTRTRIYDHVWDERYVGLSNTLGGHIMDLRRKLEAYGPRLIHTLRGRGFLFGEARGPALEEDR